MYVFPQRLRLTHQHEFAAVFFKPLRTVDRYFTVLFTVNVLDHPRLGLAISRKAVKHAVARNRIKRIVRENFRLAQHRLGSVDIIIMARREAVDAANSLLHLSLQNHWRQILKRCGNFS